MQGPSDQQELVTMQPELVTMQQPELVTMQQPELVTSMQQPELVTLSSSSVVSLKNSPPARGQTPDKPATSSSDYVDVRVYEKLMYKCLIV